MTVEVGVDGTPLSRLTDGIGRWSANVVRESALARPDWRFTVLGFADDRDGPYLLPELPNVRRVLLPFPRRAYQAVYSRIARVPLNPWVPHLDALLATNFTAFPAVRGVPSVVTVFDLTFVDHPEVVEARNLVHLRRHVPRAVREAAAVTAISPFTTQRIAEQFPDHAPVHLVDCGLDPGFLAPGVTPATGLPTGYVLAVGTLEPRKNLVTLLRAYARLSPELRRRHPLVVVGRRGWGADELPADVPAGVLDDVTFTGYVQDADLPGVYAGASLFVFPSIYEGFGLPLLEAMAAGVPAVVSDIPPFRDIGGDLVDYVAPHDVDGFVARIAAALDRPDRARAARAQEVARSRTWARSGQQMVAAVESVLR